MKLKLDTEHTDFHSNLLEGKLEVDNSRFTNMEDCFTKGLFSHVLKKERVGPSMHLDFGSIVHSALEQWYKSKGESSMTSIIEELQDSED